jgi:hypothetical protein
MKTIRFPMAAVLTAACFTLTACDDGILAPDVASAESDTILEQVVTADVAATLTLSDVRSMTSSQARAAVEDVTNRLLPALEQGGLTTAIGAGLLQALTALELNDVPAARLAAQAANQALDQYERRADAARAPDIDAVRLTIEAFSVR